MKATLLSISSIALAVFAPTITPAAIVASDFSSGLDGWTVVDLPLDTNGPYTNPLNNFEATWVATGGNPSGHLEYTDLTSNVNYFQAPASYLGNKSSAFGLAVEFDVRTIQLDGSIFDNEPDIILVGGGLTLVANLGAAPTPGVWTHFTALLSEAGGWRQDSLTGASATAAQLQDTLSSLSALRIRGEFVSGNDRADLDNVVIVPEPSSTLLLLTGAAFCLRRRPLRPNERNG